MLDVCEDCRLIEEGGSQIPVDWYESQGRNNITSGSVLVYMGTDIVIIIKSLDLTVNYFPKYLLSMR